MLNSRIIRWTDAHSPTLLRSVLKYIKYIYSIVQQKNLDGHSTKYCDLELFSILLVMICKGLKIFNIYHQNLAIL